MTTITLHIPIQIWQRIRYYIDACTPREVTGIGTITRIDSRTLRVTKVFLPNQCSSAGYCECDDEALNGIIFNLVEDNPALAGLSSILLKIIQPWLAIYVSVGIHTQTGSAFGLLQIRRISIIGSPTG